MKQKHGNIMEYIQMHNVSVKLIHFFLVFDRINEVKVNNSANGLRVWQKGQGQDGIVEGLKLTSSHKTSKLQLTAEWMWKLLSHVWLFAMPWTIQSMEFSRPEYWSG